MKYCQLTSDERYLISQLRKARCGVAEIAEVLGRHRSTIYREIKRNLTPCPKGGHYCHSKAQERRNGRLRRRRRGPRHEGWQYARVESLLLEQWTSEQIAAVLRKGEFVISFQSIYRHVRRDWRAGGTLYQKLRRCYRRRKRHYGLERRIRLQGKRKIEERQFEIEMRSEVGLWEIDTVMGASREKTCIVTLVSAPRAT